MTLPETITRARPGADHRADHQLLHERFNAVVHLTDYAVDATGATDSAAGVAAAVADAESLLTTDYSRAAIIVPPGIFKLSSSGAFTPPTTFRRGIHFIGVGMYASVFRLATAGSDLYFYNNAASPRANFCSFTDIGFEGCDPATVAAYTDIPTYAKGFRLWATGATGSHEQGFRFTRCRFDFLNVAFETAGDQTTSEISWFQCKINHIRSTVYSINNLQSVNHQFNSTDIENVFGDVFSIGALGGGAIKMYGGSVIMLSDTGADTYFFKNAGSSGLSAYPFTFNGVRFEFRGNKANLCNLGSTYQATLRFNDSHVLTTATSNLTNFCKVGAYDNVIFSGVSFGEQSTGLLEFHCTSTNSYGESGTITFDRCELAPDWSDRCYIDAAFGHICAIGCWGTNIGAVGSHPYHWAHDFDLHWNAATAGQYTGWAVSGATLQSDGSPSHHQWRLKTAQVKLTNDYWPDSSEHSMKLPKNAIIKNIHLRKPASGADATSVTFRVGRLDKTGADHLTSNTAAMNTAHTGDVTNYFYHVGSTTNERTLLLWTNENPSGVFQGGLCIVEYY